MKYFTSDWHVGHDNILNLGGGRPFGSLNHMHTTLVNNYYSVVTDEDEVYFVGDIAMGNLEQSILLFRGLPGKKFFIAGNHDRIFTGKNNQKRIDTFTPLYEEVGFTILSENLTIVLGGREFDLSHFPYHEDSPFPDKFAKNRPVDNGRPLIHGHTHHKTVLSPTHSRMFHIGVDAHNFMPVSELEIIEWAKTL